MVSRRDFLPTANLEPLVRPFPAFSDVGGRHLREAFIEGLRLGGAVNVSIAQPEEVADGR